MEYKIKPSRRLNGVNPSAMRELFEIANQMRAEGKRVIDFGLGDIDIPLPEAVLSGIKAAVDEGKTKYGPNPGEFPLRDKIAEKYNLQHNLNIDSENVLVTCGSLESLFDISIAYVNPGDNVLIAEPEFAYFGWQVTIAGGKPKPVGTTMETEFAVKADDINQKIDENTKAVLVNYPNNPTAGVLEKDDFKAIVEVCEDNNILLISDEAYEQITYDGFKHMSALDFGYENTLVVNSSSKSLCMTGLRVGYTVTTNTDLLSPVLQVHQYNTAHAAVNNQYGVLAGLQNEKQIIDNTISVLQERRDAIVESWGKIPGMNFFKPRGTFYLYPNIKETGMNGKEFTKFALEHGVVVTPGNTFCFDKTNPGGYDHVRVSYGITSVEEIKEAGAILKEALENR